VASFRRPDDGHMHVLTPSFLGYATKGMHSPSGNSGWMGAQRISEQRARLLSPLRGHVHVLHPSLAAKSVCGQQLSSGSG